MTHRVTHHFSAYSARSSSRSMWGPAVAEYGPHGLIWADADIVNLEPVGFLL